MTYEDVRGIVLGVILGVAVVVVLLILAAGGFRRVGTGKDE